MSHLASPRRGWQGEHLGLFILSRIAFVASPVTVSDDLGSDFFCNLFEVRGTSRSARLHPRHAFAIQIKSSADIFDVTNKRDYLRALEVPYFVGVIDQVDLALTLFSGEFMPLFFAKEGMPSRMKVRLIDADIGSDKAQYVQRYGGGGRRLVCPRVLTLRAGAGQDDLNNAVRLLQERCDLARANIAALRSEEHVYRVRDPAEVRILAGPGSAKVFRGNLYLRLAEVFANFWWLAENQPAEVDKGEWLIYRNLRSELRGYGVDLPEHVERTFAKAEAAVHKLFEVPTG